jgi:hypothetical protein
MELLDQNEQRQMLRGKFDPVFQVHGQWNSSQWLDFPKYVHSSELITDRYYVIYVGKNNDFVDPCGYHLRLESSASIENDAFEDYKKWIIALHDKHKKEMQMELLRSVEPQSK